MSDADVPEIIESDDDLVAAEYQPGGEQQAAEGGAEAYEPARPRPSAAVGVPVPALPKAPAPVGPAAAAAVGQDAGEPAGRAVGVLPLGAGLALVGLGLGFLGLRLRRN